LAGRPAVGKTTVARFLSRYAGYQTVSVGELLKQTLLSEGVNVSSMAEVGPLFLKTHPAEALDEIVFRAAESTGPLVLDAIRLLRTAESLRKRRFALWFVDAPEPLRTGRLTRRVESASPEESHRLLVHYDAYNSDQNAIKAIADRVIMNDGSIEALEAVLAAELT
jgi:dephospho-CoA kinase